MVCFDTIFPADTVEFCPHPKATDLFICGTYRLIEESKPEPAVSLPWNTDNSELEYEPESPQPPKPQKRVGECLVLQMDSDRSQGLTFKVRERIFRPAITDVKWCHRTADSKPLLAMAQVDGKVVLMSWEKAGPDSWDRRTQDSMDIYQEISIASSDVLCLSLDWSNRRSPTETLGDLVVSLSDGNLCLLRPTEDKILKVTNTWHAHDFEPWAVAWDYWNTNIIYSGGDDLKLKGWDTRAGFDQPTFVNKRFDAGVTSIQSHPYIENLIAVGSYNNTVRLFDVRNPYRPITEADVGGGAWRVKWHPSPTRCDTLLVACMHSGARVIRFDGLNMEEGADSSVNFSGTLKHFEKHESMAYGADWSWEAQPVEWAPRLIATCSFYDHILHTWTG